MSLAPPRQCVVLVGGRGTRLGPLTADLPKPLLPVGGRPFLQHVLLNVRRFGFDRFVLLAGHCGHLIEEHCGENSAFARELDAQIVVIREPSPRGTGGALRLAASGLDSEFLLINGDTFFDINFLVLERPFAHELGRIALRSASSAGRYGVVEMRGNQIKAFRERSSRSGRTLVNAGVYLLRREAIAVISHEVCSLERDVFPDLAQRGALGGQAFDGFFIDIGVPEDLRLAETALPRAVRRPAIFFDRDGVLNLDRGYTHLKEEFEWMNGAREAVRLANDEGYYVFVVTNQSGVARGLYDEGAVGELHRWMNEALREGGAHIDDFRYCPHHPEATVERYRQSCGCRKPQAGMILDLMRSWPVEPAGSLLIGDKELDLEAARRAGIAGVTYTGGSVHTLLARTIASRAADPDCA